MNDATRVFAIKVFRDTLMDVLIFRMEFYAKQNDVILRNEAEEKASEIMKFLGLDYVDGLDDIIDDSMRQVAIMYYAKLQRQKLDVQESSKLAKSRGL